MGRTVLMSIQELVVNTNGYIECTRAANKTKVQEMVQNRGLLEKVAVYITRIFDTLGLEMDRKIGFASANKESANTEDLVMPYKNVLASFRDNVRIQAKSMGGNAGPILKECDSLRDETLPQLGVRLEDKEDEPTVIKLVNKEELMKEKEEKRRAEQKKKEKKKREKKKKKKKKKKK